MTVNRTPAVTKHPPYGDVEDDLSIHYPSSDGEPMAESEKQYFPLTDTVGALKDWYIDSPDVYAAGNMLMYYRINDNTTSVAPDVYVVFGAVGKHPRDSWLVWREGKAPDFVLEIASPGTWRRDAIQKREIYAEMGVTEYWRFDPTGECFTPGLVGERLSGGKYEPIPIDTDGAGVLRGHSAVLSLDMCVLPGLEFRLYDPVTEQWLLTYQENAEARRAANAARQEEAAGRRAAEAARQEEAAGRRAAEAARQEEVAGRQAAEAGRQAAEAARQEEAAGRQAAEAARQAAEEEIRLLREQLRSLQSGE